MPSEERDAEMLGDPGSVDYYVRQLEEALRQRNAECRALRSEEAAMATVVEAADRHAREGGERNHKLLLDALDNLDALGGGRNG